MVLQRVASKALETQNNSETAIHRNECMYKCWTFEFNNGSLLINRDLHNSNDDLSNKTSSVLEYQVMITRFKSGKICHTIKKEANYHLEPAL